MNFFLDSTVFQNGKDVFMNNRLSREFLNICRQQNFSIYISSVVLDETRRQFNIFMSNQLKNISAGIGAINTIPMFHRAYYSPPNIENVMRYFDLYFKNLEEEGIINIVPYCNDFLPDLIHRSIYRIKPFTESKQEFRDAVIWFSYAKIAEEQQLENCYLISGNTTDYLNKKGQIHEELAEKSNRFILFKDMYSLLDATFMQPYKATHQLLASLKQKEWDLDIILNFLKEDHSQSLVIKHLTDDADDKLAEALWSDVRYSHGSISNIGIIDSSRASIRGVDFINNEFIISGSFEVEVQFVSSLESEIPDLRDSNLCKTKLIIYFDAAFDPDSNTYKSLEISSYDNAYEYWEGVHRVGQDRF